MFCGHCGKEIKEGSSFCCYCGEKITQLENDILKNVQTEEKNTVKKKKRKWPWIFAIIIVIVTSVIIFAKKYIIWNKDDAELIGIATGECYIPNTENIVYENDSNTFGYVNNMVLVFFDHDATIEEISEIVENMDGQVVGKISGINQYQIEVETTDKAELETLCEDLWEYDIVKNAMLDYVVATECNELPIPNDPWKDTFQGSWGAEWNENNPKGSNWWFEATKVLSAWKYDEYFSTINVGVVDNGFDINHEDLDITVINTDVNSAENHGTHIAGVIGATVDNNKGISGILNSVNLYGVDCYATSQQKKNNVAVSSLMDGIVACLEQGCKVVNMSSGVKFTKSEETQTSAKETARIATIYLLSMLDSYEEEFIIVQSAGNGNKGSVGVDALKYNGYFCSITESVVESVFDELEEKNIVPAHDISVQDVLDSVMIVGAVDKKTKDGNYQLSKFSNYGENVTVCAPGVSIFSTTVSGGMNGSYGYNSGTSMAAPIAAGITAMVWSVDPTMTSEEVKEIIVNTSSEAVLSRNRKDSGVYHMINAEAAVKKAVERLDDVEQWTVTPDSFIYVYDKEENLANNYQVKISFLDLEEMPQGPNTSAPKKDTEIYEVTDGKPFKLSLTAGIYEIIISSESAEERYVYYALVAEDGDSGHSIYTTFEAATDSSKISRVNYYDFDGNLIYYDTYAYYDNGLLCSVTLHSVHYYENEVSYTGDCYTILYLYDAGGNLKETVLGSLTISEWYDQATGEIILDYQYDENGKSTKISIFPLSESIEQKKYNVDSSRTENIYGEVPIISTDLSSDWATVYLNEVFAGDAPTDMTVGRFIYVDDNQIPELWMDYGYGYAGSEVFTINNGTTDSIGFGHGWVEWVEYENLLLVSSGHMDHYADEVYKIENNEFVMISHGNYGAVDNSNVQIDENGDPIYEYYWNDSEVTKEEYAQNLTYVFEKSKASEGYEIVYSYEQCKALVKAIANTSDKSSVSEENLQYIFLDYIEGSEESIYFFRDDFDSNGTYEAFGITGIYSEVDGNYSKVNIYFVASDGTITKVNGDYELYGYCPSASESYGLVEAGDDKFLVWEKSAGGSGSCSYIYGVDGFTWYEPEISGNYEGFSKNDESTYVAYISSFENGYHEWLPIYYTYDQEEREFIENQEEGDDNSNEETSKQLSEEMLQEVKISLGVPADLDVTIEQGECSYWDVGQCYLIYVEIYYEGKVVAYASVDADTGELVRNIWNYSE